MTAPRYPLPEAITPGHWEITGADAAVQRQVNVKQRYMAVPLDGSALSEYQRNQALGHTKWALKSVPKLEKPATQQTVDALHQRYVDAKLAGIGLPAPQTGTLTLAEMESWRARSKDLREYARLVAAHGTTDAEFVLDLGYELHGETVSKHTMTLVNDSFDKHLKKPGRGRYRYFFELHNQSVATRLAAAAFEIDRQTKLLQEEKEAADRAAKSSNKAGTEAETAAAEERLKEAAKQMSINLEDPNSDFAPRGGRGKMWAEMQMLMPSLPNALPQGVMARRATAIDEGAVLRYPHRFTTDGRIFANKPMRLGSASVLIDVSGSMHLTEQDIYEIMLKLPGSIMATYAGHRYEDKAWLTIVGKNGRSAKTQDLRHPDAMYNACDGPAMRWLLTQPHPRVWVSDGYINGYMGWSSTRHYTEVMSMVRVGRVLQVPNLDVLTDLVNRKRL